jgi:DNA mismatch endonuclease Vsr
MQANHRVSRREVAFRRALWHAGARGYRLEWKLPGRPDLVFPRLRLAVFVNGCFWHSCDTCQLPQPRANAEFWLAKLSANRMRDERVSAALIEAGWRPVTVWEHEIRPDPSPRARSLALEIAELRAVAHVQ